MTRLDPRTPVLVGAGTAGQRCDDPTDAVDVVELMVRAAETAAADAGAPAILGDVAWVAATKGNARLADPARLVADRVGAADAHTVLSDIGVLQTAPLREAARLIADAQLDSALVVGGETKFRSLRAQITGAEMAEPHQADGVAPDEHWVAEGDVISRREIDFGLVHPVQQYAMIENALRAAEGQSIDDHRRAIAELYAAMNVVAQANPAADFATPMTADQIREPSADNRPLAFPYNKWHNSQWNVDQAAALILCSAERADALGIPRDRWVFPTVTVESNHMTHLIDRDELHRCLGFEIGAPRLYQAAQVGADDLGAIELYSCFPAAVRVQQRAFGLDPARPVTVTGGMAFAGGPLNNFVLQALVELIARVREGDGPALSTAVSGMLTKQSMSLYAADPPTAFRAIDVSGEVAASTRPRRQATKDTGCGHVAAYTVTYQGTEAVSVLVIAELDDGTRTLVSSDQSAVVERFQTAEVIGTAIEWRGDSFQVGGP
ncbi:MAG: hypothetical protein OES57_03995 [Acidimicrobiia bacterium]|nr:hypothetical protein [Acidimicrobiia bacterium]